MSTPPGQAGRSITIWSARDGRSVTDVDGALEALPAGGNGVDPAFGNFTFERVLALPSDLAALRGVLLGKGVLTVAAGDIRVYREAGTLLRGPATKEVRDSLIRVMRDIAGPQVVPATDSRGRAGLSFPDPAVFGATIPIASRLIVDPRTARPLERESHQDAQLGTPLLFTDTYLSFSTQPPPAPYDK